MVPPPAHVADGGGVWPALLILGLIVWFLLQFRPSRRAVWKRRFDALRPVGQLIIRDVRAILAPFIAAWEAHKWDDT